jgi:hypothetical protein
MKIKPIFAFYIAIPLANCGQKKPTIEKKAPIIERTTRDDTKIEHIRRSAETFKKILDGENNVSHNDWIRAHLSMMRVRNEATISTFVEFLKSLEYKIPKDLPQLEEYEAIQERNDKLETIENNLVWTISMMAESIKEISLYDDPAADVEIEGILKRFKEKHGNSETGKKILDFFNIVHEQGLEERSSGTKPWESPEPGSSY